MLRNNTIQIAEIVAKLLSKTESGLQQWISSISSNRYLARFGNFSVEIYGPGMANFGNSASIKITKLDGSILFEGGGFASITSANMMDSTQLDGKTINSLNRLYSLVSDRSKDLDALLKLI